MMMMMVVSLSEHAKQPLSLPLPPKVFFHLSFTSLTLCSWLFFQRLVNIVSPLHYRSFPQFLSISLFSVILPFSAFLSFCFSLSLPLPLDLPWHWYCDRVVIMWSYNLFRFMWWCAVQGVVNTSVGVPPFGSYSLFFDSVVLLILLLQLVVNQTRKTVSQQTLFTQTKTSFQTKVVLFCFSNQNQVYLFWIDLCWGPQAGETLQSNKAIHR